MNVIEAINKRKSVRRFTEQTIDKKILEKIISAACQAPSAMNTQPWEFSVVTGSVLDELKAANIQKIRDGAPLNPEHEVVGWGKDGVFRQRQVELAKKIFALMDIAREDKEKRNQWLERGFRFFDAPVGIIMLTDKTLHEASPLLDLGAAMQNICLAAIEHGLGTCIEDQAVVFPDVVRNVLQIPDNKRIIIAIAIGYPDWEFPANELESGREPLESNCKWLGFD